MHVTYPGDRAKSQYRYYVCNNRLNHQSCRQDYVRADLLEQSILQKIAKLAERKDVITALVADFVARVHKTVPELEEKRDAVIADRAVLAEEKQNLSWWLLGTGLSSQSVAFINAQIDERTEKETRLQEQPWGIEDRLTELQSRTYNAHGIADRLYALASPEPVGAMVVPDA